MASDPPADEFSADDFIEVVYEDVFRAAQRNVFLDLERPVGRNPSPRALALSEWYANLPEADRARLREVVREAADDAVFGMLALLDNVRPVTDGFTTKLRLHVEHGGEVRPLDSAGELHDIFRWRVDQAE